MQPLIIAVSGKKQSGKSSLCEFINAWYTVEIAGLGKIPGTSGWNIIQEETGQVLLFPADKDLTPENSFPFSDFYTDDENPVKVYNFADRLKEVCINVLGLSEEQCYGTDAQKNSLTNLVWDNFPDEIRLAYSNENYDFSLYGEIGVFSYVDYETGEPLTPCVNIKKPRSGPMTAREVMQVLGTDVFRKMFSDMVWVNATFTKIRKDETPIALIADCRFPSELNAIMDAGGYVIRLNRKVDDGADQHPSETALDDYDFSKLGDRALFIDNSELDISAKNELVIDWISEKLRQ